MRIVSAQEMRKIEDRAFNEFGMNERLIIENVGIRGADLLYEKYFKNKSWGEVVVLVGPGNNGADGLAIARHLRRYSFPVRAFLFFPPEECNEELKFQVRLAKSYGVKMNEIKSCDHLASYFTQGLSEFFVIDAIFGTGVRFPLSNFILDVIGLTNQYATKCVSIDIPSGVDSDTGDVGPTAIKAHLTLCVALPKVGHYAGMGAEYRGELEILEVGFPAVTLKGGPVSLLSLESARNMNRRRDKYAHKGLFGHVLLIGGSPGMTGALILASTAALKSGAGLVTAATWDQNYSELTSRILPEIMTGRLPEDLEQISQKISFVNRYDAIVVGPGLGRSAMARQVVLGLLNHYPGPLVIDADGINALNIQEDGQTLYMRNAPTFLTPHVGEFARFTGKPVEDILARPLESLKELVSSINCSVLLKGPCSFLGRSSGEINLSYYPNDSLATAGSGDVLAGLLGGLFAQNAHNKTHQNLYHTYNLYDDAACVGLMAHSLAGKHARISCGGRGSSAGLIIDKLADAFKELETIA